MADLLIKGERMPENCIRCKFQFGGFCSVAPAWVDERVAPTVDAAWKQGKPSWCPLIKVEESKRIGVNGEWETIYQEVRS